MKVILQSKAKVIWFIQREFMTETKCANKEANVLDFLPTFHNMSKSIHITIDQVTGNKCADINYRSNKCGKCETNLNYVLTSQL